MRFGADLERDAAARQRPFLIHGKRATCDVVSEEGRTNAAHNRRSWTAMKDLKVRAARPGAYLGGADTQSGAGIARFKLEAGGKVLLRAGAFV